MDPAAVASFVGFGLLSPVLVWLANIFIGMQKNRRAYVALREAPIVYPGSHFSALFEKGVEIMGAGRIQSLERSCIALESADGSHRMFLNCVEFQAMHPHWTTTDDEIRAFSELGDF